MGKKRDLKNILIVALSISLIVNAVVLWKSNELKNRSSELEQSFLGLFDDSFSSPTSKLQSIQISLEHGGWNNLNLKDMTVTASLKHMRFWHGNDGTGGEVLYEVKESVSNYSPVIEEDETYRYIWYVIVSNAGPSKGVPPPGMYLVDAATGEIVTW